MDELIKIKGLTYSYGQTDVLDSVDLDIRAGDFAGIIGGNGTGKSTLVRLITGSLKPQSGEIKISAVKEKKSPVISYVAQMQDKKKSSFPATVEETVMMGLYSQIGAFRLPKKIHRQKVQNALEMIGIEIYGKRLIGELSGGQRQKVMIAKAIVNEPDILILDEPTTGVDRQSSENIYEILKMMNDNQHITILIISHDIKNLKLYCKSIYELEYGKIKKYDI